MDQTPNKADRANQAPIAAEAQLQRGPWPYQAGLPERYARNYPRYLARGGAVRPEDDVRGFVAAQDGNRGDMARFYFFCLVLDQLDKEGIVGDLAELGVYKGATASLLAKIARQLGTTAYLLDTYEGFNRADFTGVDAQQTVQFTDTSLDSVKKLVGDENVCFVKGYFPESVAQLPDDAKYCVVHIDCDLYMPMLGALRYFYPRLVPGGFMIMHDYSSLHWDGAERAIDEFFADKVELPIPLTDGAGSAVIRKAKQRDRFNNWLVRGRASLTQFDWRTAAHNGIRELLGEGWSGPEDWGVWGVGAMHELFLYLRTEPTEDIILEADAHAALIGARQSQTVEIWTDDHILDTWTFTPELNRAVRRLRIPRAVSARAAAREQLPAIRLEFRPRDWTPPSQLDPSTRDGRPLGLALWRIRLVPAAGVDLPHD